MRGAVRDDPALAGGVTTVGGQVTNAAVAEALGVDAVAPPTRSPDVTVARDR